MDVLACRSEGDACKCSSPASTMLFHGLLGGEMQGVIYEMGRRAKGDSTAISSAIDMGETETVGKCFIKEGPVKAQIKR